MKLLALIPAFAIAVAAPAQAWSNELQWRTTTCQIESKGEIIGKGTCNAAFAYDTHVRAIKYRYSDGSTQYFEVGQNARFNDNGDCLDVTFSDGDEWTYCTVPSSIELGIVGD